MTNATISGVGRITVGLNGFVPPERGVA